MITPWYRIVSYRRRQLFLSSCKRALRWEFWPMWVFYIPVVMYILTLVIRYRGLAFTAANPGLPGSGVVGENKSLSLLQLQTKAPEQTAKTCVIDHRHTLAERVSLCQEFMQRNKLSYPVVLKPDFGQRGMDVGIIHDENALTAYLQGAVSDILLQEHIAGVEFGVFYIREPHQVSGQIFSLTHKCFPTIKGDGKCTIEQLICEHPRLHYMLAFLLDTHQQRLHQVPQQGEQVNMIELGSHCRGALFLEGQQYASDQLSRVIDQTSQHLSGFYFGRYDVRAKDIHAFERGEIKIIELNGVTSESTNIYDPKYSVLTAYKILFEQWRLAFKIGQANIMQGNHPLTLTQLISKARMMTQAANDIEKVL